MSTFSNYRHMLEEVVRIARLAGDAVLEVYATDFDVRSKIDASPVTAADERAEERILQELSKIASGIPVVSEEAGSRIGFPKIGSQFWLVDPLDGTKEFVNRNGEFTVNIALVEDGEPVLGVVLAPALGRLFCGATGVGSFAEENGTRRAIVCRPPPSEGMTVVSSRSHGDREALQAFLADRRIAAAAFAGSSLKFCLIASGQADLYPRLGRTMEWDTAAGHAVLAQAGGQVTRLDGVRLKYGKPQFENPHFVATGSLPNDVSPALRIP